MRAVLFGLFETLCSRFDPAWKPPARTTAERLGVDQRFYDEHWGRFEKQWEAGVVGPYERALAALCSAAGVPADPAVLAELKQEYVAYIARTAFARAEPEILHMLQALRGAGLKLGVVTNANDLDSAPWHRHEVAPFFEVFVASHEVRLLKPDPKIYGLACERLSIPPDEIVFVGDGGSNELHGATEAGIEPLWSTWFLDRWPEGTRPNDFPGGDWRQRPSRRPAPYRRLRTPAELLAALLR